MEEMVGFLKKGDMSYFDSLFLRFHPLVNKFCTMYRVRTMEREDLYQESRIVLLEAIQLYDGEKGLKFAAYYKLLLQHHIYNLLRKDTAMKRRIDYEAISYDFLHDKNNTENNLHFYKKVDASSPESILEVKEATMDYFDKLSDFEQEVFRFYLEGLDKKEIAVRINSTLDQVQNAYDRCRQKLKRSLL